jgi:hypothetical protein
MRSSFPFICLLAGVSLLSCKPASDANGKVALVEAGRSQDMSIDSGLRWTGEGAFQFVFTDFHFEVGQQIMSIDSEGAVRDLFSRIRQVKTSDFCSKALTKNDLELCTSMKKLGETQFGITDWRLAHYTLSPVAQKEVREVLLAARFEDLKRGYSATSVSDGTTHTYSLRTSSGEHGVSAYAAQTPSEPPELLSVLRWLQTQQREHTLEREASKPITDAEHKAFETEALRKTKRQ